MNSTSAVDVSIHAVSPLPISAPTHNIGHAPTSSAQNVTICFTTPPEGWTIGRCEGRLRVFRRHEHRASSQARNVFRRRILLSLDYNWRRLRNGLGRDIAQCPKLGRVLRFRDRENGIRASRWCIFASDRSSSTLSLTPRPTKEA